jgi:mRNA interferase MazF
VTIRRGDIYWFDDGERQRPVAVLTRNSAIPLLSRLVVAPATRTARGIPTEVALTAADGLKTDCVLSLDNIRVVPKRFLKRRITTLSPERLEEIREAIRFALVC